MANKLYLKTAAGEEGEEKGRRRSKKRRKKEAEKREGEEKEEEEGENNVGSIKKEPCLSIQWILVLLLGVSQGLGTKGETSLTLSNLLCSEWNRYVNEA